MLKPGRESGQVVVEMLLILPVFLAMVFLIMETGNISFRLIVLNHATYEVARIGGMTWSNPALGNNGKMNEKMRMILPEAVVNCVPEPTLPAMSRPHQVEAHVVAPSSGEGSHRRSHVAFANQVSRGSSIGDTERSQFVSMSATDRV